MSWELKWRANIKFLKYKTGSFGNADLNLIGENYGSDEIVKNALGLLQKARSEKYNLFFNNCEYLANLCVT